MKRRIILEIAALKKQLGFKKGEKIEPGSFINKINAQKTAKNKAEKPTLKVEIMGAI